jgi:hypothetical protein
MKSSWHFFFNHLGLPTLQNSTLFSNANCLICLSLSLMLRPMVSRPVCLGIKHPSWAYDHIFYYCQTIAGLFIWGALSHERTRLSLKITAALASAVILGSEARDTRDHILLSQIRYFPFRRLLRLGRATVEVFDPATARDACLLVKLKLSYDRRSVVQSILATSTHLRLTTRFLLLSDSCGSNLSQVKVTLRLTVSQSVLVSSP